MNNLRDFLSKYEPNEKDGRTNITSMNGQWGGKWYIPLDQYEIFLKLYYEAAKNGNLKLVEKKQDANEHFRLMVDFDISLEDINKYFKGKLPKGFLNLIIRYYEETLMSAFNLSMSDSKPIITCRMKPFGKMHLHWPNIIVNNTNSILIRNQVKLNLENELSGNWDKWLDSAIYTKTGIRLLGSMKPNEKRINRYYVFKNFNDNNEPEHPELLLKLEDIRDTSIRVLNPNSLLTPLTDKYIQLIDETEKSKIPLKIKLPQSSTTSTLAENQFLTTFQEAIIQEGFRRNWTTQHFTEEMLKAFSPGPIKIGLNNCYIMDNKQKIRCPFKGVEHKRDCGCHYHVMGPEGTRLKCRDELCYDKHWPADSPIPLSDDIKNYLYININCGTINNNPRIINQTVTNSTIESTKELDFWNDLHSIKFFNDEDKDKILLKALNGGESAMAELLRICCQDKFNHTKEEGWFYWNDVKWCRESNELVRFLYRQICPILSKVREAYKSLSSDKINHLKEKISEIDSIIKKMETRDYKQKIIFEAGWIFQEYSIANLVEILDTQPYLIGFPNGVYDIEKKEFRKARSMDYISITMPYEYFNDINSEVRDQLVSFLSSIMPNDDDRHYMLKLLSTGLLGYNPNELFHIFTGSGRNGKSKLTELIKLTFGEYYESISSTFLTAKATAPNQATPHLAVLRKKRLIIGSEPDQQFKLNASLIKSLSGNDEIVGRQLYGENKSFKPFFKIILLCNNIPEIDAVDKAVWTRCRCLSFPISFVHDPKLPNERKIDEQLSHKLPKFRLAFFQLLLEYYEIFKKEGLSMTPSMLQRTRDYQIASDIYLEWLTNRTTASESNVHTAVLYEDFVNWYHENYRGKKPISQSDFIKGLSVHKEIKRNTWANGCNKRGVERLSLINMLEIPQNF
jgi:P4 family phage/plasmid primase-like protien